MSKKDSIKEIREKIEELSEKLYEEQNKRALCDTIIAVFLIITFFIFLITISPMIFAWYKTLDEFDKGALFGFISFIITFGIIWIIFRH
jgi:uncharacterized membrane protein